jgi:hypothetical protein
MLFFSYGSSVRNRSPKIKCRDILALLALFNYLAASARGQSSCTACRRLLDGDTDTEGAEGPAGDPDDVNDHDEDDMEGYEYTAKKGDQAPALDIQIGGVPDSPGPPDSSSASGSVKNVNPDFQVQAFSKLCYI